MRIMLIIWLCAFASSSTWSADDLEKELAKHAADVAKAQQICAEAIATANERTVKTCARIAQRQFKANDMPGAIAAWKEVLRLDRANVEARAFFTSLNQLDEVTAEIDAPPTDILGNPVNSEPLVPTGGNHPTLAFGIGGALVPMGSNILTEGFAARTTECIVGKVNGDGVLFEEGGPSNGQAIGIIGSEVHFVTRAGGHVASIKAPFDRAAAWTHLAVQFDGGEMRLWVNGKLAAKTNAGFTAIPAHGEGGLGQGSGDNPGGWSSNCAFSLVGFRLSSAARYTDLNGPNGKLDPDKTTLLAITSDVIVAANQASLSASAGARKVAAMPLKQLDRTPPGAIAWSVSGDVTAR